MFTGIITDVGDVRAIEKRGDTRIEIATKYDTTDIELGASIACSGPCLTVVEKGNDWFAIEASAETLDRTTIGDWKVGSKVNLERALKLGEELGGHIVSGHVDGIARIVSTKVEGDSKRFEFEAPEDLKSFIAEKGSVALEGVSLTVNEVSGNRFGVNIISHTQACTTFGEMSEGDRINLEIDMLARYVSRLLEKE
ncbi:MAG: riboflavin synthase [Rhodospirillaceae bacterium]|nr:riboflavin synthase [Rhodospirillaceae bacterium]|tara:strand:+ start:4911 stop:5498 length:588 start_codon:yes stop_codon:yes gene_type:complete